MNFTHLHHFWVIATEGSLTRAAERLEVTHSTLSMQLRALEKHLGTPLFVRKSRGVVLTPAGEQAKVFCDEIFRLSTEMAESIGAHTVPVRRAVRVGHTASIPRELILESLAPLTFAASDSSPSVVLTCQPAARLVEDLVAGRIHAALVDKPPETAGTDVYAHKAGETRVGLYATERLARRLRPGFPRSLDGTATLLPTTSSSLRESLSRWFAEESIRPRIVGEFDDVPLMKTFAQQGHAVVPIREALAHEAERIYGLRRVGTVPGVRECIYVLTPERRVRHPAIQRLVAACRSALAS